MARDGWSSGLVTVTRTADTNAYTAGDVIGAATGSTAAIALPKLPGGIQHLMITSVGLLINDTALISGEGSYDLKLYNVTPTSALGDNAAWDLGSTDRAAWEGAITIGTPVDLGSSLYIEVNNIGKQIATKNGILYAYLVTSAGYTPSSARVYNIRVRGVLY